MFDLPNRLRVLRTEHGMHQEDLAEKVGMDRASISRLETGRQHPTLETAQRLAAVLGVAVEELGFGAAPKEDHATASR